MKEDKRILVVDDEEVLRTTISQVLTEEKYSVVLATNGAEALQIYQKDPFELIMTDIVMPHFSGIELLKAIKGINPEAQIIVISARPEAASQAVEADAFVNKFDPPERILSVLKERNKQ